MIKGYNEIIDKGAKVQAAVVGGGLTVGWLVPEGAVISGLINGTFDAWSQYIKILDGSINWNRVTIQTGTGLLGTIAWNSVGGVASNAVEGEDPLDGA